MPYEQQSRLKPWQSAEPRPPSNYEPQPNRPQMCSASVPRLPRTHATAQNRPARPPKRRPPLPNNALPTPCVEPSRQKPPRVQAEQRAVDSDFSGTKFRWRNCSLSQDSTTGRFDVRNVPAARLPHRLQAVGPHPFGPGVPSPHHTWALCGDPCADLAPGPTAASLHGLTVCEEISYLLGCHGIPKPVEGEAHD